MVGGLENLDQNDPTDEMVGLLAASRGGQYGAAPGGVSDSLDSGPSQPALTSQFIKQAESMQPTREEVIQKRQMFDEAMQRLAQAKAWREPKYNMPQAAFFTGMMGNSQPGQPERDYFNAMQSQNQAHQAADIAQQETMGETALQDVKFGQQVLMAQGTHTPSAVQEYQYYDSLNDADKQKFLAVKRAQQVINLGGQQAVLDPTGGIRESYDATLKPGELPTTKAAQARATESGKALGEKDASLRDLEANLPALEQVVGELSVLGKQATYTKAGRLEDIVQREAGFNPGEDAVARAEYINKVRTEVFPILRATFGAQFTRIEGEKLESTLGDPNLSSPEKDAMLRAFIDQKKRQIKTLERETGSIPTQTQNASTTQSSMDEQKILAAHPDAKKATDGFYYIKDANNKWHKVLP